MAQLSWRHHTLIQSLLSRGHLKESEFHSIFKGITGKNPVQDQHFFNKHLHDLNKELSYVKFELRGCINQYDGKVYYGVVNTQADEQSKLGTKYSVPQIAFYKAVAATCPSVSCPIRIHEYCLKKKFSQRKVAKVCPCCSRPWQFQESYEEQEEVANEHGQGIVPSDDPITRKRLRRVKAEAVETAAKPPAHASGLTPRKRLRSCKAEAVEATHAQAEESLSSIASQGVRRSRHLRR